MATFPPDYSDLARALGALSLPPPPSPPSALSYLGMAGLVQPPPRPNAFGLIGAQFGGSQPNALLDYLPAVKPVAAKVRRRVFYSFHYADIMRVNVVRKAGQFQPTDGVFDNSLWERTKRQGEAALKKLIADGMYNSSVTCVLAGAETWARPWVRYEIALSLARGNGLLVAYIDDISCAHGRPAIRGHDPTAQLAVGRIANGDVRVFEYTSAGWTLYARMSAPIRWPKWLPDTNNTTHVQPLDGYVDRYSFDTQDGYKCLAAWADRAALRAGKQTAT